MYRTMKKIVRILTLGGLSIYLLYCCYFVLTCNIFYVENVSMFSYLHILIGSTVLFTLGLITILKLTIYIAPYSWFK